MTDATAPAGIGHNLPPAPTPFETLTTRITDLYGEAKLWLDGDPITTDQQHDTLIDLVEQLRAAQRELDALRKEEAKPHDEAKTAIQARYNKYIQKKKGIADIAIATANDVLSPYLYAKQQEKVEADRKAREEAERKQAEARSAMQASRGDLEAREKAERLAQVAKAAERAATKVAKAPATKGARTVWDTEITDMKLAGRAMWKANPDRFRELTLQLGREAVRGGAREIEGFEITERRVV